MSESQVSIRQFKMMTQKRGRCWFRSHGDPVAQEESKEGQKKKKKAFPSTTATPLPKMPFIHSITEKTSTPTSLLGGPEVRITHLKTLPSLRRRQWATPSSYATHRRGLSMENQNGRVPFLPMRLLAGKCWTFNHRSRQWLIEVFITIFRGIFWWQNLHGFTMHLAYTWC